MARIILPSPATSVGCERLLNFGRDICHYRRGHVKPESIRKLVMMRHFDAKELAAEDLGSEEEESTKPDSAPTRQDLDWAWHYINNQTVALPTAVPGLPRQRRQEVYFARPRRTSKNEVEAVVEEHTSYADADQQEEYAQRSDEAAGEEEEEAEEEYRWHESDVENGNERFEIVGNSTPSSDEDIPSRHGRRFEDEVADAVNEADGSAESETEDEVVNQRRLSGRSVFYESQELPSADLDDDLESIEHPMRLQSYESHLEQVTVPTSAQRQQSPTPAQSSQATSLRAARSATKSRVQQTLISTVTRQKTRSGESNSQPQGWQATQSQLRSDFPRRLSGRSQPEVTQPMDARAQSSRKRTAHSQQAG